MRLHQHADEARTTAVVEHKVAAVFRVARAGVSKSTPEVTSCEICKTGS